MRAVYMHRIRCIEYSRAYFLASRSPTSPGPRGSSAILKVVARERLVGPPLQLEVMQKHPWREVMGSVKHCTAPYPQQVNQHATAWQRRWAAMFCGELHYPMPVKAGLASITTFCTGCLGDFFFVAWGSGFMWRWQQCRCAGASGTASCSFNFAARCALLCKTSILG
jgi:hypothetical protein